MAVVVTSDITGGSSAITTAALVLVSIGSAGHIVSGGVVVGTAEVDGAVVVVGDVKGWVVLAIAAISSNVVL